MKHNKRHHKISDHFSMKDFSCKCEDCKGAIRVSMGLVGILELIRSKCRNRVNIHKGFICIDAVEKLSEPRSSCHAKGLAADITVDNKSPEEVFLVAESIPEIKGLGLDIQGEQVHVDTRKEKERFIWVEDKGKTIPLNTENRSTYIKDVLS